MIHNNLKYKVQIVPQEMIKNDVQNSLRFPDPNNMFYVPVFQNCDFCGFCRNSGFSKISPEMCFLKFLRKYQDRKNEDRNFLVDW